MEVVESCPTRTLQGTIVAGVLVAALLFSTFGYRRGWIRSTVDYIETKRRRLKLLLAIIGKLSLGTGTLTPPPAPFTVNGSDASASISYEHLGTRYKINVPYRRRNVPYMAQFKAELLRSGMDGCSHSQEPLDISQQPGIPYLVTAEEMGGAAIRITNLETGLSHVFEKYARPGYAESILM